MSPGVPPDSVVASPARSVLRFLPILEQVRQYQGDWLRGDLVAGVVVAALIIPKNRWLDPPVRVGRSFRRLSEVA